MKLSKKTLLILGTLAIVGVFNLGCSSTAHKYNDQSMMFTRSNKHHSRTCSCHYCVTAEGSRYDAGRPLARMSSFRRR